MEVTKDISYEVILSMIDIQSYVDLHWVFLWK